MAQKVTVGGERLGSGKKIEQNLHDYEFSTFNLEQDFKSSIAPGVLYPFLKIVGTNHDTFDIDLDSFMRTIPTRGPLFGSYKFQVDLFNVPFRLYQGVLHNNPVDIGLDMDKVYLPKIEISTIDGPDAPRAEGADEDDCQINNTALEKYLGLSGIGHVPMINEATTGTATRKLQCIPELAYYDIFKNYYANKQEQNAYVITPGEADYAEQILKTATVGYGENVEIMDKNNPHWDIIYPMVYDGNFEYALYEIENFAAKDTSFIVKVQIDEETEQYITITLPELNNNNILEYDEPNKEDKNNPITFRITSIDWEALEAYIENFLHIEITSIIYMQLYLDTVANYIQAKIELTPFALKNIDKMRSKLLACNELNQEFIIRNADDSGNVGKWENEDGEDGTGLPYCALVKRTNDGDGITWNAFKMNGLCVKTYQSDIFNNWLDTESVNKINQISAVAVVNGSFTLDSLAMSEKVWKLLNRILLKGSTYEDWQEARYGEGAIRKTETPMYVGGMSTEIMFEEVVSTSETKIDNDKSPLGSLGGKGTQYGKSGGNNIHVKFDEPGYIIGICSLTPRINQCQGNDWDRTELKTMNDLHAPELDGIGFQDLIVEQFAWWNTKLTPSTGGVLMRDSAGKQIAWQNYMTAYDKTFGDFAKADGYAFMVLNRNYNHDEENRWGVADITTYIDPAKYNYVFAYSKLDAQNFWCRIHSFIRARRKMAAQQIPNL